MRPHAELIIEKGDNTALVIETDSETQALGEMKFSSTIIGTIILQ